MEQRQLDITLQMQALITEREGMIAENYQRLQLNQSMAYVDKDFQRVASQFNQLVSVLRGGY